MEHNRPYFRLCAATFAGGALTFLAISILAPQLGALGSVISTLCGALLGFIMVAPVAFARAIPRALRATAPYFLWVLVGCCKVAICVAEAIVEGIRVIITPRPVLWITYGIPMWAGLCKFGDPYFWLNGSLSTMTADGSPSITERILCPIFVLLFGTMVWVVCFALVAGFFVIVTEFDPATRARFKRAPTEYEIHKPGYWVTRLRKEACESSQVRIGVLDFWFEPLSWTTGVLFLLDITFGTMARLFIRVARLTASAVGSIVFITIQILFKELPRFVICLYRLVHSDLRLICMVDAPAGALAMYLCALSHFDGAPILHMGRGHLALYMALAGIASLTLGLGNYALIARRWLKVASACEPVAVRQEE